jgi:hypothetical protein
MRAAPAGRIPLRAGEDGSAFATLATFRGKLPASHLSRTAGFVCFATTIRDSEQPVWASILWRAWEANFVVKTSVFQPLPKIRDHVSRQRTAFLGNILVAGLGSQIRATRG